MPNTNCLQGRRCPTCGNEDAFRVVGRSLFTVTDDGTDFGADVEYDEASPAYCAVCDWAGVWGDLACAGKHRSPTPSDIADAVRWFDDLCDIAQNNPADVEDWITNGADHFEPLRVSVVPVL